MQFKNVNFLLSQIPDHVDVMTAIKKQVNFQWLLSWLLHNELVLCYQLENGKLC